MIKNLILALLIVVCCGRLVGAETKEDKQVALMMAFEAGYAMGAEFEMDNFDNICNLHGQLVKDEITPEEFADYLNSLKELN